MALIDKKLINRTGIIKRNTSYEAESIEQMLRKAKEGESIELGGKELLYTEKKDGVLPATNIRTDKWEIAQDALDTVERTRAVKEQEYIKKAKEAEEAKKAIEKNTAPGGPTDGTLPN